VSVSSIYGRPDAHRLGVLGRLIDAGDLEVVVQDVLPLAEAARAHELLEERHVRGKLVLDV
jgi:NADPH:quinone reductase-like Zn-dependent oxidoreductase